MKRLSVLIAVCLCLSLSTNCFSADELTITYPFAFKSRFHADSSQLGFPGDGVFLQVGCFVKASGSPIKEVTARNLDTGVVLRPKALNVGSIWSGLYEVSPMSAFDPGKHLGTWELRVINEKGDEKTAKTHKLNLKGQMPYVKNVKASGNPLAPVITWTAPDEKNIPEGAKVRYRVRLLKNNRAQFYKLKIASETSCQVPEGKIQSEDLSQIYIRIECQGWDASDKEHSLPLELRSNTILPLKEALAGE